MLHLYPGYPYSFSIFYICNSLSSVFSPLDCLCADASPSNAYSIAQDGRQLVLAGEENEAIRSAARWELL